MLTILVLLILVVMTAVVTYLLAAGLSDGIGSWARER